MKITQQILLRLKHRLQARNAKGFGIHSPFLFGFVQQVLRNRHPYYCFARIEAVRRTLKTSDKTIYVQDYGTGNSGQRRVATIARTSIAPAKDAQMLFRIARYINAKNILELGTSLGITTSYLASVNKDIKCVTMEGSAELIRLAKQTAQKVGCSNIHFVQGDISECLSQVLEQNSPFDLICFDANHTFEYTIRYFEECVAYAHAKTVFVLDDIHSSKEMNRAWKMIVRHEKVTAAMQLKRYGVVFFNTDYAKKLYCI